MTTCAHCGSYVACCNKECSCCRSTNSDYAPLDSETISALEAGQKAWQAADFQQVVYCFTAALDRTPDILEVYFYLETAYSALHRYKEAIQTMEKAQQLCPGSAPIAYNLGLSYKQLGHKREARKYFETAYILAETDGAIRDRRQFMADITKMLNELKWWKFF